ncbi:hypothetical protein [Acuticoccus kalidii]|uniref:hypothetical protein n=1 Tax=Acuticoccus kalidii TaxID=2910977 RepID=UPI003F71AAA8
MTATSTALPAKKAAAVGLSFAYFSASRAASWTAGNSAARKAKLDMGKWLELAGEGLGLEGGEKGFNVREASSPVVPYRKLTIQCLAVFLDQF